MYLFSALIFELLVATVSATESASAHKVWSSWPPPLGWIWLIIAQNCSGLNVGLEHFNVEYGPPKFEPPPYEISEYNALPTWPWQNVSCQYKSRLHTFCWYLGIIKKINNWKNIIFFQISPIWSNWRGRINQKNNLFQTIRSHFHSEWESLLQESHWKWCIVIWRKFGSFWQKGRIGLRF